MAPKDERDFHLLNNVACNIFIIEGIKETVEEWIPKK